MKSGSKSYPSLLLSGRPDELELASALLFEVGCLGTNELDSSTLRAFFPPGVDLSSLHRKLVDDFPTLRSKVAEPLRDEDWLIKWKKGFHGFSLGKKFFVLPSWEAPPSTGRTILHIDPERAFGTGTHDTTRLSIDLIEEFARAETPVIDAGAGTGILSMAAAALGCRPVVAIETDPDAVACARANIIRNHLEQVVCIHKSSIANANPAPASLVLANLSAKILHENWTHISNWVHAGGYIVTTGLLLEQVDAFLKELPPWQHLVQHRTAGGWAALLIQRTGNA